MSASRLAVWGDPIAHSKSPALHAAAYEVLGVEWRYDRRRVTESEFGSAVSALDDDWRGLSLTMPLKEQAFRRADRRDPHAQATGAVNTLLLGSEIHGFNTDVGGIIDALAEHGMTQAPSVRILGAGATAASALVAAGEMGATYADVRARRPEQAQALVELGAALGVTVTRDSLDAPSGAVDLTIATLPSGTVLDQGVADDLASAGGVLFDAAYAPWPSALATTWGTRPIVSGLGMLLHQAVRQIRIFVHGDPMTRLEDEDRMIAAMRAALAG